MPDSAYSGTEVIDDYRTEVPSLQLVPSPDVGNSDTGWSLGLTVSKLLSRGRFAGAYGRKCRLSLLLLSDLVKSGSTTCLEDCTPVLSVSMQVEDSEEEKLLCLLQHAANSVDCTIKAQINGTGHILSEHDDWCDPVCGYNAIELVEEIMAAGAVARRPYVAQGLFLLVRCAVDNCLLTRTGALSQLTVFIPQDSDNSLVSAMLERAVSEVLRLREARGESDVDIRLCHRIHNGSLSRLYTVFPE